MSVAHLMTHARVRARWRTNRPSGNRGATPRLCGLLTCKRIAPRFEHRSMPQPARAPQLIRGETSTFADSNASDMQPRRPRTIRTMLTWAVVAWVVPAWICVAIGILSFYNHEREHISQSTISTAHALESRRRTSCAALPRAARRSSRSREEDARAPVRVREVFSAAPSLARGSVRAR